MKIEKTQLENEVFSLLKAWCDALIRLQIDMPGRSDFDGALLCPACKVIHGRCHDAIYPMMAVADRTGDDKYLTAAKKLFQWGENMLCDDRGLTFIELKKGKLLVDREAEVRPLAAQLLYEYPGYMSS